MDLHFGVVQFWQFLNLMDFKVICYPIGAAFKANIRKHIFVLIVYIFKTWFHGKVKGLSCKLNFYVS